MKLKQLLAHRKHIERIYEGTLSAINIQIAGVIRKRKVACAACNFRGQISDWTFIRAFKLRHPCGLDEGDWVLLPTAECFVQCPSCNLTTTVAEHLYHMEFMETAEEKGTPQEKLFGRILEKYGDQEPEPVHIEMD